MNKNLEIGTRIKHLRTVLNKNQTEFVAPLNITQSALSYIEKGNGVSTETLMLISKKYHVSLDWLMDGKGEQPKAENINSFIQGELSQVNEAAAAYSPLRKNNIVFVPLVAYGGFMEDYENLLFTESLDRFSLPGIHGEHAAFEVSGSSMEPFVYHQETVIAKPEERIEWMVKGRAYVIVSVRGIHVKFFVKIDEKEGKAHFKSANKAAGKFDPIPLKEIKKIYQVVRVLEDPYKRGYLDLTEN